MGRNAHLSGFHPTTQKWATDDNNKQSNNHQQIQIQIHRPLRSASGPPNKPHHHSVELDSFQGGLEFVIIGRAQRTMPWDEWSWAACQPNIQHPSMTSCLDQNGVIVMFRDHQCRCCDLKSTKLPKLQFRLALLHPQVCCFLRIRGRRFRTTPVRPFWTLKSEIHHRCVVLPSSGPVRASGSGWQPTNNLQRTPVQQDWGDLNGMPTGVYWCILVIWSVLLKTKFCQNKHTCNLYALVIPDYLDRLFWYNNHIIKHDSELFRVWRVRTRDSQKRESGFHRVWAKYAI